MQPKAKTLQERMGFRDDELSTPRHDEIMLWLDEKIDKSFSDPAKKPWNDALVANLRASAIRHAQELDIFFSPYKKIDPLPETPSEWQVHEYKTHKIPPEGRPALVTDVLPKNLPENLGRVEKIWEKAIVTATLFTVGFIDMAVNVLKPTLGWSVYRSEKGDMEYKWSQDIKVETHMIEVKPKIDSLGEVIRQIRFYQTHCQGKFYVCCPDNRFEKQLASQWIGFIRAEV